MEFKNLFFNAVIKEKSIMSFDSKEKIIELEYFDEVIAEIWLTKEKKILSKVNNFLNIELLKKVIKDIEKIENQL